MSEEEILKFQDEDFEDKPIDWKSIWKIILLICVIVILFAAYTLTSEILSAKKGCELMNGKYKLNLFIHLCDNKPIFKYTDGVWAYENRYDLNISEFHK